MHAPEIALPAPAAPRPDPAWIHGRGWDLRWLIGSALIGPVILALGYELIRAWFYGPAEPATEEAG